MLLSLSPALLGVFHTEGVVHSQALSRSGARSSAAALGVLAVSIVGLEGRVRAAEGGVDAGELFFLDVTWGNIERVVGRVVEPGGGA